MDISNATVTPDTSTPPPNSASKQLKHKAKTICPLCSEAVFNLARHLRSSKHNWSSQDSKYAKARLNIRKSTKKSASPVKRKRNFKKCTHCPAVVKRLDVHNKKFHSSQMMAFKKKQFEDRLFETYHKWLLSPDSGGLTSQTTNRSLRLIKHFYYLDQISSIENILNENLIRNIFETNINDQTWVRSTAGTYLYGLTTFYKYLLTRSFKLTFYDELQKTTTPYETIKELATYIRQQSVDWAKCYVNENRPDAEEKYDLDLMNLLTQEEKKVLKYGKAFEEITKCMEENDIKDDDLKTALLKFRNYIAVNIFVRNGHRNGVAGNFTQEEFSRAKERDGAMIINVKHHKTRKSLGCAQIIISKSFFQIMQFYEKIRQRYLLTVNKDCKWFLITREGTLVDPSNMNHALHKFLKYHGIKKHVTTSTLRKTATSSTDDVGKRKDLSTLMMHHPTTANVHYERKDREAARLRAYKDLNPEEEAENLLTRQEEDAENLQTSRDTEEVENLQAIQDEGRPEEENHDDLEDLYDDNNRIIENEDENYVPSDLDEEWNDETPVRYITPKKHIRKLLDSGQEEEDHDHMKHISDKETLIKKVDRIDDDPESDEQTLDIENVMKKVKRSSKWGDAQTRLLLELFEDMILRKSKVSQPEIKRRLNNARYKFLKSFTGPQIDTRLRYIMRILD